MINTDSSIDEVRTLLSHGIVGAGDGSLSVCDVDLSFFLALSLFIPMFRFIFFFAFNLEPQSQIAHQALVHVQNITMDNNSNTTKNFLSHVLVRSMDRHKKHYLGELWLGCI